MDLLILNTSLEAVTILDSFESSIWVDRYNEYGDFELYIKASEHLLDILKEDYYIWIEDSEHVMIIEDFNIKFDVEDGDYMVFTGRSVESILERRIIWNQTVLTGNLQNGIQKLLNENVISPSIPERAIPNFIFEASTDPAITSLTIDSQFTGKNLYETIKTICMVNNIGFKITLSNTTNQFVFKLYSGSDRSYDQLANPYVVFSSKFENIIGSNYSSSKRKLKTVSLVAGEGEGEDRKTTLVGSGTALDRREMYTDARDISQTVDGVLLSEEEYIAQLSQRGIEDLSENKYEKAFDAQVDAYRMFKYGEDFFIGDTVQLVSGYGITGKARVIEIIHSNSTTGIDVYPTFMMIE